MIRIKTATVQYQTLSSNVKINCSIDVYERSLATAKMYVVY